MSRTVGRCLVLATMGGHLGTPPLRIVCIGLKWVICFRGNILGSHKPLPAAVQVALEAAVQVAVQAAVAGVGIAQYAYPG